MKKNYYLSDYLGIESKVLSKLGVFNRNIMFDSPLYINLRKLKESNEIEFENSYSKILQKIEKITKLIKRGDEQLAINLLASYNEAKFLGLGLSAISVNGNGIGEKLAKNLVENIKLYLSVNEDFNEEDIFHMIGFITHNISSDRMTDIVANIIREDIENYNKRILSEIGLEDKYRGDTLFLPVNFLSNIPIFTSYTDFILNSYKYFSDKKKLQKQLTDDMISFIAKENSAIKGRIELNQKTKSRGELSDREDVKKFISNDISEIRDAFQAYEEGSSESIPKNNIFNGTHVKYNGDEIDCDLIVDLIKKIVNSHSQHDLISDFYKDDKNTVLINEVDIQSRIARELQNILPDQVDISLEPSVGRSRLDLKVVVNNKKLLFELKRFTKNSKKSDIIKGYEIQFPEYLAKYKPDCSKYIVMTNDITDKKVADLTTSLSKIPTKSSFVFIGFHVHKPPTKLKKGEKNIYN